MLPELRSRVAREIVFFELVMNGISLVSTSSGRSGAERQSHPPSADSGPKKSFQNDTPHNILKHHDVQFQNILK
jgi:hypothetical protein